MGCGADSKHRVQGTVVKREQVSGSAGRCTTLLRRAMLEIGMKFPAQGDSEELDDNWDYEGRSGVESNNDKSVVFWNVCGKGEVKVQ